MKIILMSKKHIKAVGNLFFQAFGPKELGEPWIVENSQKHIEENFSKGSSWVVIDNNAVVASLISSLATFEKGTELFVYTIVVKSDYRNKGIGTKLIQKAMQFAKKNKLVGIRLLSNPELESFKWYQSMGFNESGWKEQVLFFS